MPCSSLDPLHVFYSFRVLSLTNGRAAVPGSWRRNQDVVATARSQGWENSAVKTSTPATYGQKILEQKRTCTILAGRRKWYAYAFPSRKNVDFLSAGAGPVGGDGQFLQSSHFSRWAARRSPSTLAWRAALHVAALPRPACRVRTRHHTAGPDKELLARQRSTTSA